MAHQAWDYRCEARTRKLGVGGVGAWDRDVPGLLAGLGEEGWELVTVVADSGAGGAVVVEIAAHVGA